MLNKNLNKTVRIQNVEITGNFWKEKQDLIRNETIPYIWDALNDRIPGIDKSAAVTNFKSAAGLSDEGFFGLVSQDSDLAKWMEAASYSLMTKPDPKLDQILDEVIAILEKAQEKDGYLNSHYSVNGIDNRWTFLRESCELYCAGHLLEAAVAHFEATGKRTFLEVACRYADHMAVVFGKAEGQKPGYCGHAEVELALVKLYRVTGEEKYLELSKYFVEERGQKPYYFSVEKAALNEEKKIMEHLVYALEEENFIHSQSHLPVREQEHADGHAVKAMYLYCAMADLAIEYKDESLLQACKRLWNSVVQKRMYVTGGIGSSAIGESFTIDYDLPNDGGYTETCASIGLIFLAQRMLQLETNSKYADVMERALYNGMLGGLALNGKQFFYTNPLEVWPDACEFRQDKEHLHAERQHWFDCPCCPPNISRLITSLGQYIYTYNDQEIATQLYVSNRAFFEISGQPLHLEQTTNYPWDGNIQIRVSKANKAKCTLAFRIPEWSEDFGLSLNGKDIRGDVQVENGYVRISGIWSEGDTIGLVLKMEAQKIYAHPKLRYNGGKVALQRGPLVYCMEEADNGETLSSIALAKDSELKTSYEDGLLHGVVTITADAVKRTAESENLYSIKKMAGEQIQVKAVPYYAWSNRGPGEMTVWINEK